MAAMANEADDLFESSPTAWHKELESLLTGRCSKEEVLAVCLGRPLPSYLRNFVWQHCLGLHELRDPFIQFDGLYNTPEQAVIRKDCGKLIEKLRQIQAEEDLLDDLDDITNKYISLHSDVESVVTLYCKRHDVTYSSQSDWIDILAPLLLCDLLKCDLYNVFEAIVDLFVVREPLTNRSHFLLFRLLLLYHDPQLCTFLDSTKIFPELYASKWFSTLFSHHSSTTTTLRIWDVYLQQHNQHFVFYLGLVILVNARDEIMAMDKTDKQAIIDKIASFPSELEPDDVEDFCSLAQYYLSKTPVSFGKMYESLLFNQEPTNQPQQEQHSPQRQQNQQIQNSKNSQQTHTKIPQQNSPQKQNQQQLNPQQQLHQQQQLLQQLESSLCLHTSLEELLSVIDLNKSTAAPPTDPLVMMTVDCRSAEHYKRGHLTNAQHLNSHLMLQNPQEFSSRVQSLLSTHNSESLPRTDGLRNTNVTSLGGEHLCFLGYGGTDGADDEDDNSDDGYMNMVVSHLLHKQVQYVSMCHGGYKALHQALIANNNTRILIGHNNKHCHICNNNKQHKQKSTSKSTFPVLSLPLNEAMITEKFGRLTSVLKVTSGAIKDKVIGIMKNEPVLDRHVSSTDRLGRGYRNMASVFTIDDDDDENTQLLTPEDDVKEVVVMSEWLSQYAHPKSVYECLHITNHPTHPAKPSLLCLNDNHLIVLQKLPDDKTKAILQTKRPLFSILKITSKRKQPELITIKYGASSCLFTSQSSAATSPAADTPADTTTDADASANISAANTSLKGGSFDNTLAQKNTAIENSTTANSGDSIKTENSADNGTKNASKVDEKAAGENNNAKNVDDIQIDEKINNDDRNEQTKEHNNNNISKEDTNLTALNNNNLNNNNNGFESTSITAIDRFLIPKAGEATTDIKNHIQKLVEMVQ